MFVSLAQVDLTPEHRDAYLAQMIALARRSLESEAGTQRYQIIQDAADPNRIHVVEGYRDRAAFEAHMQGEGSARFLAAYAVHPEDDGRLRFRDATTGETAAFARLWSGTAIFPSEREG
jgi:autoinducer 2-degrading protein